MVLRKNLHIQADVDSLINAMNHFFDGSATNMNSTVKSCFNF